MPLPHDFQQAFLAMVQSPENHSELNWHTWWKRNHSRVESELPRTVYLKLKFKRLEGAAELLDAEQVPYNWSVAGRRRLSWARLDESFVDELGQPKKSLRSKAYGGALAAFARGDVAGGTRAAQRYILVTLGGSNELERAERLGELVLDAETLFEEGEVETARHLAGIVAAVEENDLLAPVLRRARALMMRTGRG